MITTGETAVKEKPLTSISPEEQLLLSVSEKA